MTHHTLLWIVFAVGTLSLLVLDLGVLQRKTHEVKLREALVITAAWILLALAFNAWVYFDQGRQAGLEFFTGYVIEKALSLDNLFVFLLIFTAFRVSLAYQHKVLSYGVFGALLLRGLFVLMGVALINTMRWTIFLFGAVLLLTGIKMLLPQTRAIHPEKSRLLRLLRRKLPMTEEYVGTRFLVKQEGRWMVTPLLFALIAVEISDVIFAVDSVPAVFAVTRDPFIVYTSNAFAVLGLRALYSVLAGVIPMFRYLHYGIAAILAFVGAKMLLSETWHISTDVSLVVVLAILLASLIASLLRPSRPARAASDVESSLREPENWRD